MDSLKFSILIPTYNGADTILETLKSIFKQTFTNYEIIIQDDASTDSTEEIIKKINNKKIRFFKSRRNSGYPKNLEIGKKHISGDILFLMGQDDILARDALEKTYKAFMISQDIGAVTRPYYWFDDDIHKPVRAKKQLNPNKDEIVTINDNYEKIITMFSTLDQLSGLALRVKYMDLPFHPDIFPCHVYPFASIFKKHPVVFLKDYNTAVRIRSSQSRNVSSIYEKSPLKSWVDLFNSVFYENKFSNFRKYMISNFVAINYVGLVQIKNYAEYKYLLREIYFLLKYRWENIFQPLFWFFSIITLIVPSLFLRSITDLYKKNVNSAIIRKIDFFN